MFFNLNERRNGLRPTKSLRYENENFSRPCMVGHGTVCVCVVMVGYEPSFSILSFFIASASFWPSTCWNSSCLPALV